ncbi:hypothetical protein GH714_039306 [Hevea brasiliensis]|uniref:Fungal lipase-type domain-containing protein n=1 Tax=Hevea brasiliensis TaxID=3981 RepID=A0A6A6MU35_HEVBR|nr:hypothetical protein GH714_039278 [Hevea brasiliensis]KAF2315459.1 hypothetical protein GH714_039306 [Hevea brasiliensis]
MHFTFCFKTPGSRYTSLSPSHLPRSLLNTKFPVLRCSRQPKNQYSFSVCALTANSAKLGKKWMEYQGINNWEGLLDPLDDNLRREILRYGQFVEAAYRSFDFNPSSPTYATSKFPRNSLLAKTGFGETGYRMTKNLRATCGYSFPVGLTKLQAGCQPNPAGLDTSPFARTRKRLPDSAAATCGGSNAPMVESGFLSLYTSCRDTGPSLQNMVREEIARVLEMYGDEPLSFTITGHSLGAALATLTAYDIKSSFCGNAPMVTVISFGGPRVGNRSFRCQLENGGTKILRIVNSDDLITKVPGFVIDNNDVSEESQAFQMAGLSSWVQKRVESTQWVYSNVGRELRLSSKESPYLSKRDIATCHELSTYLHLVNGFVSSSCPFRTTAKKMLNKHHREKLGN